jgi:hypothetical protein
MIARADWRSWAKPIFDHQEHQGHQERHKEEGSRFAQVFRAEPELGVLGGEYESIGLPAGAGQAA